VNVAKPDFLTLYEQAASSIDEACSMLAEDDWDLPSDCPGWTLKDNLSHLVDYEATALGRPRPEVILPDDMPHVRNDFGKLNEAGVHARRERPGKEILEEFREVTAGRLDALRAKPEYDETVTLPVGELPAAGFAAIRLLDLFFHEQDIRRAAGLPGHMEGALARFAFERMATVAAPRVIAKDAAAPDGSVVVFDVPEPGRSFAIAVTGGRGDVVDAPADAAVRFTSDLETFLCLFGGRWSAARAVSEGRLKVEGDPDLAKRVLDAIVVVP
jgi:uncharacterized protein (TIGR03083 family)